MKILTEKHILSTHSDMIAEYGGIDGIRDKGLLDSALNAPYQTFGGIDLYPDLLLKAAVLCRSIICNHPFIDGNKRSGIHSMILLLKLNGVIPKCTQEELIELGLSIASGKADYNDIYSWLLNHT